MDAGLALVDYLFQRMEVEEEWAIRRPRGFTWWARDLAQYIWAEEPFEEHGTQLCRVHAETDLLGGFDGSPYAWIALGLETPKASVSGLVVDDVWVRLATSICVESQSLAAWSEVFAQAAVIQLGEADTAADELKYLSRFWPAVSAHPTSGSRNTFPEAMFQVKRAVVPAGAEASRFVGDEFEQTKRNWGALALMAGAGPDRLSGEWWFRNSTAWVEMRTREPHPQYGNGLLVILTLPVVFEPNELWRIALTMNSLEGQECVRSSAIGSWCPNQVQTWKLSHVSFLPNCMHRPGLIADLFVQARARSDWAEEALARAITLAGAASGHAIERSSLARSFDPA